MAKSESSGWAAVLQNRVIMLVLAMVIIVPFVATPADNGTRGLAALVFEGMSVLLLGFLLWKARWKNSKEDITNFLRPVRISLSCFSWGWRSSRLPSLP